MKASTGDFLLSASDLSNHLACRHLTSLDFGVAIGERSPPEWRSPDLWVLEERGLEHENAEGNVVRLQPSNVEMEPIYVPAGQVAIQGRVLGVLRKYR